MRSSGPIKALGFQTYQSQFRRQQVNSYCFASTLKLGSIIIASAIAPHFHPTIYYAEYQNLFLVAYVHTPIVLSYQANHKLYFPTAVHFQN